MPSKLLKIATFAFLAVSLASGAIAQDDEEDTLELCDQQAQEIGAPYFNLTQCCASDVYTNATAVSQEYQDLCDLEYDYDSGNSTNPADPDTNSTNPGGPNIPGDNSTAPTQNATTPDDAVVAATPRIVRRRVRKTQINIHDIESGSSTVIISSPADYKAADADIAAAEDL